MDILVRPWLTGVVVISVNGSSDGVQWNHNTWASNGITTIGYVGPAAVDPDGDGIDRVPSRTFSDSSIYHLIMYHGGGETAEMKVGFHTGLSALELHFIDRLRGYLEVQPELASIKHSMHERIHVTSQGRVLDVDLSVQRDVVELLLMRMLEQHDADVADGRVPNPDFGKANLVEVHIHNADESWRVLWVTSRPPATPAPEGDSPPIMLIALSAATAVSVAVAITIFCHRRNRRKLRVERIDPPVLPEPRAEPPMLSEPEPEPHPMVEEPAEVLPVDRHVLEERSSVVIQAVARGLLARRVTQRRSGIHLTLQQALDSTAGWAQTPGNSALPESYARVLDTALGNAACFDVQMWGHTPLYDLAVTRACRLRLDALAEAASQRANAAAVQAAVRRAIASRRHAVTCSAAATLQATLRWMLHAQKVELGARLVSVCAVQGLVRRALAHNSHGIAQLSIVALQATVRRLLQAHRAGCHGQLISACTVQGFVRRALVCHAYHATRLSTAKLQASVRCALAAVIHAQKVELGARLLSVCAVQGWVRQALARHAYVCCTAASRLQAFARRLVAVRQLGEVRRACSCICAPDWWAQIDSESDTCQKFGRIDFGTDEIKVNVVAACRYIHQSVMDMSQRYWDEVPAQTITL